MAAAILGELVPTGGGDPIPLTQDRIVVGRRESCDICLKYQNVSSQHCEFAFQDGIWKVRDLNSSNGTKVKGERISTTIWTTLSPNEEVKISSHSFTIQYVANSAALEAAVTAEEDIFSQSLMEKAGLEKPKNSPRQR